MQGKILKQIGIATAVAFALISPYAAAETITLDLGWGHWNADVQTWLEKDALPAFEAAHPGVHVDVRYNSSDDVAQLLLWQATGMMPDVFSDPINNTSRFGRPLDAFVAGWEGRKDIVPALMAAGSLNGHQYLIPWSVSVRHFFYRTDLFAEAGLDAAAPPKNWPELLGVAQRLTRYDAGGKLTQYGFVGNDQWIFESLYYQAGGAPYPVIPGSADWPERDPSGRVVDYLGDLYRTAFPQGGGPTRFGAAAGRFAAGNAAVVFDQSNSLQRAFAAVDPENIAPFPPFAEAPGERQVSVVVNLGLALSADSKHPQTAWALIEFLTGAKNAATYNTFQARLPANSSLLSGGGGFDSPLVRMAKPLVPYAIGSFMTDFSGMGPINNLINQQVTAVYAGKEAPNAAVDGMRTSINALRVNAQKGD